MDGFSAVVCGAQALQYALSVVKSLFELRNALKYGGGYLRDEQAGVLHLREIIIQLMIKDKTGLDPGFESHLKSISTAVNHLLRLLQQQRRLQVAVLLVIRKAEVRDSFALLERKKTTLNLYLTAQNTAAIASLTTSALSRMSPSTTMSPRSHAFSEDSTHGSQPSSSVQSGPYPPQNGEILSLPERRYPEDSTYGSQPSSLEQSRPYPPQNGEIPSSPERLDPQHSGSGLDSLNFDRQQLLRQQHESNATPDSDFHNNTAFDHATQNIYKSPFGKAVNTLHENNESSNHAFQEIGQLSSGRTSRFSAKSVVTKMLGTFHTKECRAKGGAIQRLYAPDDPSMTSRYVTCVSDTGATQNLGMDVGMDPHVHKRKKWGIS